MVGRTRLYMLCCQCEYNSDCIYKFVCFFDGLFFSVGFVLAILGFSEDQSIHCLVDFIASFMLLYCTITAWTLLYRYNENAKNGDRLYLKTSEYLKIRKWYTLIIIFDGVLKSVTASLYLNAIFNSSTVKIDSDQKMFLIGLIVTIIMISIVFDGSSV